MLGDGWEGLQQRDGLGAGCQQNQRQRQQQLQQQQQQQQAQAQLCSASSARTSSGARLCCDWAACALPERLTTQEMDSWHNEGLVLPQFMLDCYSAMLGMASISDATDWLQMHATLGSSVEDMGASLLSWLLPTLTPDKSCEGHEQLIKDTAATLHPLLQSPPSQVLLQATARSYSALASALQQHQQQAQQLAAAQQVLQPGQQGVPVMDARGQHSSSQEVADWLRRQQAEGRLAAAVLMPQHSCAAGMAFAKRVLAAHMPVAFPALSAGGFQEAAMMRGSGFAKLNLLLELAVARWATVARDSIALRSSLAPLGSAEGYAALAAAVRAALQQQQQQGIDDEALVLRVPYIYNANPCDKGTADDSLVAGCEALGLLRHFPATSGSKLKAGFTWLTASPAAEAAAAAAAAAGNSSSTTAGRLPPVYGCHATNTSAQLDLDAAAQTLAAVPTADATLVQLLDDGLGAAVRAFGRPQALPAGEHRLLEANLFGILLPVMILSACLTSTRWHVEDVGLGAMNVMAWGAPKLWLMATTQPAAERLMDLLERKLVGEQAALRQLLHKQLLFHHISLQEALGCGLVPFVQAPGTALFTLPGLHSLHVTVSAGFSVAVSGNNFFSSSSSLAQHVEALAAGQHGSLLFPAAPAEGGWDRGHAEARERLAPLLVKLAEAKDSAAEHAGFRQQEAVVLQQQQQQQH
ncbi:hypothetical protein OEZ86_000010 [Tetradesmus obliquus]|nr:hypothetical protein OEZ86_000010 [Tetradesmus obliquus]